MTPAGCFWGIWVTNRRLPSEERERREESEERESDIVFYGL